MKFPLSPPSYDFPDYYPLARKSGITWLDEDKKHLYLFGGEGGDPIVGMSKTWYLFSLLYSIVLGMLNDLWYYSVDENKWTLVSGSEDINNKGDYTSENKRPGARSNALAWFDKDSRKAYIFGGLGYDESTYGKNTL